MLAAFLQVREHGLAVDVLIYFEARIYPWDLVLHGLVSAHLETGRRKAALVRLVLEVLLDLIQHLVNFSGFVFLEGLIHDLGL